jgi:spore maturation protein CgeB
MTTATGPLRIIVLGLSITSSWGNGHATNFRGLVRALTAGGHDVLFLERDVPWYAEHRDLPAPPYGRTELYQSLDELRDRFVDEVRTADVVVVGSYVPEGIPVGRWVTSVARGVTVFDDIDTPVTLASLERRECEYLTADLVGAFDLYLSFTGGPTLDVLEQRWGARRARAFHCLVDLDTYSPQPVELRWDLGYLGTYSDDRQPALDRMLVEPATQRPSLRTVVAGPLYPDHLVWPRNVDRIDHLAPAEHPAFYSAQRLTVNVTRADMVRAGWSPSVRLFEAAACGVPIVSDRWPGLESFFRPGTDILLADTAGDVLAHLDRLDDARREEIGVSARARILAGHTAEHRAAELETHVRELLAAGDRA